jgi:small nuclear ribonucleoprotein (snRNP)-like protein
MDEEKYKIWIGKKVYLITKANRRYSGIIKTFDEQHLSMIDKFNELVIISTEEISSMEEEK